MHAPRPVALIVHHMKAHQWKLCTCKAGVTCQCICSVLQTPNRFGLSRGSSVKKPAANGNAGSDGQTNFALQQNHDFSAKLLHLAWHPENNLIAAAASNSLYMYAAR